MTTVAPSRMTVTLSGRELALQRRQALARHGKTGIVNCARAQPAIRTVPPPGVAGDRLTAAAEPLAAQVRPSAHTGPIAVSHGRLIAMQRRQALSSIGRAGLTTSAASRPSGRIKARHIEPAPPKVEEAHTLSGQTITGTMVERSPKVTGTETGACRVITGTEYLGAEQFRDQCRTKPPSTPRKVSVMSSRGGRPVTGAAVDRAAKVTGNEVGSCRTVTGSQYYNSADFASLCESGGPRKVGEMHTLSGQVVTGSEVAPSPKLTGDESFQCHPVTGTDYISPRQLETVCPSEKVPDVKPVNKVAVDATLRGHRVSGSVVGRSDKVTGDEAGACAPVSGTPYIGRTQYAEFCPPSSIDAQAARVPDSAVIPATVVTGDRPGAGGSRVTGDERGACETVSGTPYLGADTLPPQCSSSGRFVSRSPTSEAPPRPPPPKAFSIVSPARQARERHGSEVTGSSSGSERITGPINKADGLITGTPEFRHRDDVRRQAPDTRSPVAALRLSGEGSQQGRPVSGDAWNATTRVTGTEGASSVVRNLSLRGQTRGAGVNAARFREIERPPVPDSVVTGSSGNTRKGATVTVSGGARG